MEAVFGILGMSAILAFSYLFATLDERKQKKRKIGQGNKNN
jgi:hypothetical protein